jgi:YidC/Oxa1 family membrane protein insertase
MSPIELLRSSLFVLAHWFGGSFGAAIVAVSIVLRVAMLPITLPATRRRLVREQKLRDLAPEIAGLKTRFAKQPERLLAATQELYEAKGVSPLDPRALLDSLLGMPPGVLLYSVIGRLRDVGGFLWIPNLVTPDRALAVVAGGVAAGIAWLSSRSPEASQAARLLPLALAGTITYLFLSHLSAGVALYSLTNSVIAAVEQGVARRTLERARA